MEPRLRHGWYSPRCMREMRVWRAGDGGPDAVALLVLPTAGGDHREAWDRGLIDALEAPIRAGSLRVYTCDAPEGWPDPAIPSGEKLDRQERFDAYVVEELLPFLRHDADLPRPGDPDGADRLITAGASLGAYGAVSLHLRHPALIRRSVALSGTFDYDRFLSGPDALSCRDSLRYALHQPLRLLHNLRSRPAGPHLRALRAGHVQIATGQGRWEDPAESRRLDTALRAAGVRARLDLWGPEVDHDWPTWRTMLPVCLDRWLAGGR